MDAIALSEEIEKRYRQYLKTTFYFRDPVLRASFEEALDSGHLAKGPFLEATPVFKRKQTPRSLFSSLLGFPPEKGFLSAVEGDRPLYQHQQQAIQAICSGRNVVVATGTGSGKTEAFVYPILLHLFREFKAGTLGSGVRALILYPMNALANDQRERLGKIRQRLDELDSSFRFTFGQYVGETPENESDSQRHAQDHMTGHLPGELVLRSEMRDDPPHILLTNYSMLEYLLLRPDDSPLFDKGRARWWTFLVLDEVHQYRGSRGIEMAMLIRRLKRRLREGGRSEAFRCIATSATIVGEEGGRSSVSKFASDLFGEEFHEDDVILGESEPIPQPGKKRLQDEDYNFLADELKRGSVQAEPRFAEMATRLGLRMPETRDFPKIAGTILRNDCRATDLRQSITGKADDVREIAAQVFADAPKERQVSALSKLVDCLLLARDPESDAPLMSARYHLFLRSLEGAFVSYLPAKNVFLDRKGVDADGAAFEVALCRECGQHYFVGRKGLSTEKLAEAIHDPSDPKYGATFFRPVEGEQDQESEEGNGNENPNRRFRLCLKCGVIGRDRLQCNHQNSIVVIKEDSSESDDKADQMARCGVCGYTAAGKDPVRELIHGTDGPHAVIATTLFRTLPNDRKKVLAFADGRQEAAFFAWYLESSFMDILRRNLLLKAARRLRPLVSEGLSLRELASASREVCREKRVFPPAMGSLDMLRESWVAVYREFLTDEPRISLEGVGLVGWSVKFPEWIEIPQSLKIPPWSFTEKEAADLVSTLLEYMRADRAVEIRTENKIPVVWADLGLQAAQHRVRIGQPGGQHAVRSWDGRHGKRAQFLTKLLNRTGTANLNGDPTELSTNALRAIWEAITQSEANAPSSDDRLLLSTDDARRLNPDWWRLIVAEGRDTVFRCDVCGRLQALSVRGICPRHRCPGTLKEVHRDELEPNHYRLLYEEDLPGPLRVEEHTAQLDKEKAREFQRDFRQGKIHVLSCSTTFELGVDLGHLDTIFLRNVPPEAFNYAQRVGRAGRRSGHPGFAVTYCRRGPHDLYHFSDPHRMLSGRTQPPVLSLQNQKIIIRHVTAAALSEFFRASPERFETIASLMRNLSNPSGVEDFRSFLQDQHVKLEEALRAIVPRDMVGQIGLPDGSWIDGITNEQSQFALSEAEVSSDYRTVSKLEKDAADRHDYPTAMWASARKKTIADEDVLSFLSRKAVIPKYGFPVDVVELDTQRTQKSQEAMEVSLQRDLAIALSEFAPTSKVVANKKEWTSYGLKRVAGKEWPLRLYKRCARHNVFLRWKEGEAEPPLRCCNSLMVSKYVIPRFGFVTDREKPKEPTSRSARIFATRPYFAGCVGPERDTMSLPPGAPLMTVRKASPGLMAVLCEGRRGDGFFICKECGFGDRRRKTSHKTPHGNPCPGRLSSPLSLGHEFVTDVLQIQFQSGLELNSDPTWFAYSLAFAVVEGAASSDVLEIPSTDLNATVAAGSGNYPVPPIILYDNVPGGAGLVARLEAPDVLRAALVAAYKRVSGKCGCDENTSCYGCLRSYRNQFAHQNLSRGPVMRYLETIITEWK